MNDEQFARAISLMTKEHRTIKEAAQAVGVSVVDLELKLEELGLPENPVPSTRLEKFKAKVEQHAPLIITAFTTIVGSACAIAAGVYAQKVRDLEAELADWEGNEANSWPTIRVHPETMEAVRNGATLLYRERRFGDHHLRTQMTTNNDFSQKANEKFNEDPTDD